MKIVSLDKDLTSDFDDYIENNPAGCLYYTTRFRDLIRPETGGRANYLLAMEGGQIKGVFPSIHMEGPYGVLVNALPYFGSHGEPLWDDENAKNKLWRAFEESLFQTNIAAATVIGNPLKSEPMDVPSPATHLDHRIGQMTPLSPTDSGEDLWGLIDGSTRRNIKKAHRAGVTVSRDGTAIDLLYKLHAQGMSDIGGRPKHKAFFERIPELFHEEKEFDIYVGHLFGEPVAALLVFYSAGRVEYFTPASDSAFRNQQPMAAIIWDAMCEAAARGYKTWNWGGTWPSQEGVYRFKRKWGADDFPYSYHTRVLQDEILDASSSELLEAYPGGFVVSFDALRGTSN